MKELVCKSKAEEIRQERPVKLTSIEIDVVKLIGMGLSNKEIARELNVELSTVKNHVHSILGKFRENRRAAAAAQYRTQSHNVVNI